MYGLPPTTDKVKIMQSKKERYTGKQFTFFQSPLANLENITASEKTIKEPFVNNNKRFDFPVLVPHYPSADNGEMESTLIDYDTLKSGDTLEIREKSRTLYTRNLEHEMRIVNHYMK